MSAAALEAIVVPHPNQGAVLELSQAISLLRIGMELLAEDCETDLLCLLEAAVGCLEPIAIFLDAIDDDEHLRLFLESRKLWVFENAGGAA